MTNNNRIEEALSALMDNEATELEVRRVLKDVSEDSNLRDTWRRYQLASAAMKRDLPPQMVDLSSRIRTALDSEPAPKASFKQFLQPLGKVAVAASVALVAVFGVQQVRQADYSPSTSGVASVQSDEVSGDSQFQLPAGYDLPPVTARTVSTANSQASAPRPSLIVSQRSIPNFVDESAIRQYLSTMMQKHTENVASRSSSQGVMPLARLPQEVSNGP